jgi:hypothetical protein
MRVTAATFPLQARLASFIIPKRKRPRFRHNLHRLWRLLLNPRLQFFPANWRIAACPKQRLTVTRSKPKRFFNSKPRTVNPRTRSESCVHNATVLGDESTFG